VIPERPLREDRVRRQHDHAVGGSDLVRRPVDRPVRRPVELDLRDPRVAVADVAAALDQLAHDLERGRFANVVDVRLVSHPQQQQPRVLDRPAGIVQRIGDLLDDEERIAALISCAASIRRAE